MALIADLHIHSRFSRATSRDLDFVNLHRAALRKGIQLVGTGDFTHPAWLAEIDEQLEPAEDGLFRLKPERRRAAEEGLPPACAGEVRFVLQVEISNIYKKADSVRKNHNLVFMPSLEAVRRFRDRLEPIGNLASDGRPILGLDARDLLEITLETDPLAFLIPAHIWTPWFSMLGSKSGFDALEECFGDLSEHIFAAETGLSSDPPMNWRLSGLDRLTLVSNSDAHSVRTLGREANVLGIDFGYEALYRALATREGFLGTVEFYPEEGKYHLDGHRKCGVRLDPEETRRLDGRCPECGGRLTVGVMSRVLDLADRPEGYSPEQASAFERLVPLAETVGEVLGVGQGSKRVRVEMERVLAALGPELAVLREVPVDDIRVAAGPPLAEAVRRIRAGELEIAGGYDGEFGTVRIFEPGELEALSGQLSFRDSHPAWRPDDVKRGEKWEPKALVDGGATPSRNRDTRRPEVTRRARGELDVDQLRAVAAGGPLLVVAGPGTGKTRTVVARIAYQVETAIVAPERVLAVAFTNQAAEELAARIQREVPGATGEAPLVTTFHALGLRLLAGLGGSSPKVLDDDQRLAAICRALPEGATARDATAALERISFAKQSCEPEQELAADPHLAEPYDRYQRELEATGSVDVDDLVLRPYQLLAANTKASSKLAERWDSISVDEYQDVNDVQAALIRLLSPDGSSLCAIGDPNQAIYGFRGARPGHFSRFESSFPGTTVVRLQTSYRLSATILAAARSVVSDDGMLEARRGGPKVELIDCPTPDSEAEQIVVRLERIVGGTSYFAVDSGRGDDAELEGVGFGDLAVLSRTRAQRRQILEALARSGIPSHSVGEDEPHDPRSQKVAVMTMHAAKGREFEVVFVTGVELGLLPLEREGLSVDPEEECRLLYVAMTRAKRLLVLSHAARRGLWGRQLPGKVSPFLARLPEHAVLRSSPTLPKKLPTDQPRLF